MDSFLMVARETYIFFPFQENLCCSISCPSFNAWTAAYFEQLLTAFQSKMKIKWGKKQPFLPLFLPPPFFKVFLESKNIKVLKHHTIQTVLQRRAWLNGKRKEKWSLSLHSRPLLNPTVLSPPLSLLLLLLFPGVSLACLYLLPEVGGTISNGIHWIMAPDEVLM